MQPQPRESSFGAGKVATGGFEGRTPNYLDGDLMVYMPTSRYPGKSLGPAYVLVMRLNPGVPTLYDSGLGASDDYLEIAPAQTDVKGRTFRFWYKVSGKPPVESFSADGRSYKPDGGRVFLVDLTADPPRLTQVPIDVVDVLPRPDQDPTLDELKAGVAKLAAKDKTIREFIARIEKK